MSIKENQWFVYAHDKNHPYYRNPIKVVRITPHTITLKILFFQVGPENDPTEYGNENDYIIKRHRLHQGYTFTSFIVSKYNTLFYDCHIFNNFEDIIKREEELLGNWPKTGKKSYKDGPMFWGSVHEYRSLNKIKANYIREEGKKETVRCLIKTAIPKEVKHLIIQWL